MMFSASPTSVARSSLEEMLDSLRKRDEELEKSKDLPPALPARPTSRARLPSARHSLPTHFRVGANGQVENQENGIDRGREESKRKEKELGYRMDSFGSKKMRKLQGSIDSNPYDKENSKQMDDTKPWTTGKVQATEWDDNLTYFIKKKLRVWCRLSNGLWDAGTIQSTSGDEALVSLSGKMVLKVSTEDLLPANPDILEGVDDLIQLSYLNEPSVLHNVKHRFSQDVIYSKAGPVLIAVNPFKEVPIYGNEMVTSYRQKISESPHIYSMADAAYDEMMRDGKSQSVIVSGESGAGKTETAKHAMRYLATLGGEGGGVEHKILQTNCILEAFGNAKTSRNENSSRFGKLIEIHFSSSGKICGATIQTFLLEKSRVAQLIHGERSYHVFYELCAGAPPVLKDKLNLKSASEYYYLNQSECLEIEGVDDAMKFHQLVEALDTLKISKEDQEQAFTTLATVLWIGNISFKASGSDNHVDVLEDQAAAIAAQLMGCSGGDLILALSTHKIQAGKDSISKKLTLSQAVDRRDALAKFIYAQLFEWLLGKLNKNLQVGKPKTGRSISVLDIYGFESFKKNSFEQFCINYANERLQQHFIRHLCKLQQEEYEEDGVDWTKVNFEDNQECLDLFEKKPLGFISLLDEESNFPKATDLTFANKLKQHLTGNSRFEGDRGSSFRIIHYAGEVAYDTNGFLEKNRDPFHSDFIQLLSACNCQLLQYFTHELSKQSDGLGSAKLSVGTKFKGQLFKLMNQLESTTPHFIRCIKPNTSLLPGVFDDDLVSQQLRCSGVLEVVRISRSGYPTRMTHQNFAGRYGFLLMKSKVSLDPLSLSVAVLQQFNVPPEMYQVGYTKVFLRMGQIATLEEKRNQLLQGIVVLQKRCRGHRARLNFQELKKGAATLQSFIRGENVRAREDSVVNSTIALGPGMTTEQLVAIIYLQSVIRGTLARNQFKLKCHRKQSNHDNTNFKRRTVKKISEVKVTPEEQVDVQSPIITELKKRVIKAEAIIEQKVDENAALREQLQQYERRWSEYEGKMKAMEEMWQKQMGSLQASLASAGKNLVADNGAGQPGKLELSTWPHFYDSEDNVSGGSLTPGTNTPKTVSKRITEFRTGREPNGSVAAVDNLAKEFEQQRQNFDDGAKALVELREAHPASKINSDEELRRLKVRFEAWKNDYKVRLKETKARLHKLGHGDASRSRRKWWGR